MKKLFKFMACSIISNPLLAPADVCRAMYLSEIDQELANAPYSSAHAFSVKGDAYSVLILKPRDLPNRNLHSVHLYCFPSLGMPVNVCTNRIKELLGVNAGNIRELMLRLDEERIHPIHYTVYFKIQTIVYNDDSSIREFFGPARYIVQLQRERVIEAGEENDIVSLNLHCYPPYDMPMDICITMAKGMLDKRNPLDIDLKKFVTELHKQKIHVELFLTHNTPSFEPLNSVDYAAGIKYQLGKYGNDIYWISRGVPDDRIRTTCRVEELGEGLSNCRELLDLPRIIRSPSVNRY